MNNALSLGNYRSCPIINSRVNKNTFGEVMDKFVKHLAKWKANFLSQAGRAVLIQYNLATKASYQIQSFTLPSLILQDLDKNNMNFF